MTLAISLSRTAEKRLSEVAKAEGIDLSTLASQLLESEAERIEFQRKLNQPTIDLLNKWAAEQATDDPEEIARSERELHALMEGLNESRRLTHGPDARTPFP